MLKMPLAAALARYPVIQHWAGRDHTVIARDDQSLQVGVLFPDGHEEMFAGPDALYADTRFPQDQGGWYELPVDDIK